MVPSSVGDMDHLDQAPEPQPPQRWAERLVVIKAADEALDGMPAVLWLSLIHI